MMNLKVRFEKLVFIYFLAVGVGVGGCPSNVLVTKVFNTESIKFGFFKGKHEVVYFIQNVSDHFSYCCLCQEDIFNSVLVSFTFLCSINFVFHVCAITADT